MNRILGSLTLLVFTLSCWANPFASYTISANKKDVYVNEPVHVVFTTRQKLHTEVMFFDLAPIKSDAYEVVAIRQKRYEFNYHDAKKRFEYLVFAKKSGPLQVRFHFSIRRASDSAVAQTYVGSRDNVKYIPTTRVDIGDVFVTLNVKKLPQRVDALGEFSLTMKLDKETTDSFEGVNVIYTVKGKGYLDPDYRPFKEIKGVSLFEGVKELYKKPTAEGFEMAKEFSYVLVSQRSFLLPAVKLRYFDLKERRVKTLQTEQKKINVRQMDVASLLDKEESPKSKKSMFLFYMTQGAYYLVAFVLGLVAREIYERFIKREDASSKTECCTLLKRAKSPEELLRHAVVLRERYALDDEIELLEKLVYAKDKSHTFAQIKRMIEKKID